MFCAPRRRARHALSLALAALPDGGAARNNKNMTGSPPVLVLDNGGHTVKLGLSGQPDPSL